MADIDNNSDLVSEVTSHVGMNGNNEDESSMGPGIDGQVGVDVGDEEMLQNALVGNGTFSEVQTLLNNGIHFMNENTSGNQDQMQANFVTENSEVNFINDTDLVQNSDDTISVQYADSNDLSNDVQQNSASDEQFLQSTEVSEPQIVLQQTPTNSAPLGSSQNPIRIIQQGNQYTPVQQLSTDQLQQIMQVVQQQQVNKNNAAGSSVLFNPQTNTRIVYRVIYPSQLHKEDSNTSESSTSLYTPKRHYKKRNKEEEPERIEGPELTKEEKEQRKKMRPKTRSGRVSKPPKHMVKDFKHIHVLDYDEDYDDSDGGYSDFKCDDEEEETDTRDDDDNFIFYASGVDSVKPKKWKCITCEKAYIGRAGLARHLRLNPAHGSIDPDGEGDMEPPDPNITPPASVEENTMSMPATPNGVNSTANSTASFSEDSRDSSVSMTYTPAPRPRGRGRGRPPRGSWRGRGAYGRVDPEVRRINKLKEATKECSDEELMEIVLPRLAKVITLWEFLLMKVEKGNPAWPHADDIYREYEKLHQHVKKLCQEYLQFVAEPDPNADQQKSMLQVENKEVAQALGLQVGPYKVKDIADTDSQLLYKKVQATSPTSSLDNSIKPVLKRTMEVVSPNVMGSPAKKLKPSPVKVNFSTSGQGQLVNHSSNNSNNMIAVTNKSANSSGSGESSAVPFMSKIKILSPTSVNGNISNQSTNSGKNSSGKSVSLLSSPLSKHSHSNSSLSSMSSVASSAASSRSSSEKTSPSQKIVIISGTNSVVQQTPQSNAKSVSADSSIRPVLINATELSPTVVNAATNQLETFTSSQSVSTQNRLILHDSVNGTYTVCSVGNNFMTNVSQANQSATTPAMLFNVAQDVKSRIMQPKVVLNELNTLNSVSRENDEFQQIITSIAGENIINRQILKTEDLENVDLISNSTIEGLAVSDTGGQKMILTLPNGEPIRIASNDTAVGNNFVYTLSNGDTSQENVFFTVDPDSMLVTSYKGDQITEAANDDVNTSSQMLQANGKNEVVGVINSIDTSESVKVNSVQVMNGGNSLKVIDLEQLNEDSNSVIDGSQMNVNAAQFGVGKTGSASKVVIQGGEIQMAALYNGDEELENGTEPKSNGNFETSVDDSSQGEIIQLPATNIFQTEDGLIFIQNADGTTLHLQGSDGQALSMETVQALLGMSNDSDLSQFVTQENTS